MFFVFIWVLLVADSRRKVCTFQRTILTFVSGRLQVSNTYITGTSE